MGGLKNALLLVGIFASLNSYAQSAMVVVGMAPEKGLTVSYNPATGVSEYDEQGYLTVGFVVQHEQFGIVNTWRESVRMVDCAKGSGYLYMRNMDNVYVGRSSWVSGGSSMASSKATLFCNISKSQKIY